jgi:hypothetical protein
MDSRFKQDNLDFIQSVGAWPTPTLLMLKRWSEEKATHEWGQLKYNESDDSYGWFYFGTSRYVMTIDSNPHHLIGWPQIEKMIDDGWMVDS